MGKITADTSTGFIILPTEFCNFTDSTEELIQRVFRDIAHQHSFNLFHEIQTAKDMTGYVDRSLFENEVNINNVHNVLK